MGSFWNKSKIEKNDVIKDIQKINSVTTTDEIIDLIKKKLEFILYDDASFFSNKVIKVNVSDYNNKTGLAKHPNKTVRISLNNFYQYYDTLMNYYNSKNSKKTTTTTKKDNEDSDLCSLCFENKIDISLKCNHFFCEKCIQKWVIKDNSCPLCRSVFTVKNRTKSLDIEGMSRWSFLSDDLDIYKDMDKNNSQSLLKLTRELFS